MKKTESELIGNIIDGLKDKLGNEFTIVPQYLTSSMKGINIESRPDLVIMNKRTNKVSIIEFKVSSSTTSLPGATIPLLENVRNANNSINPNMILVTNTKVPSYIDDDLREKKIEVVMADEDDKLTIDKLAAKIIEDWPAKK